MSKSISIIVGSVLGATEYVAEAIEQYLKEKAYKVTVFLQPDIHDLSIESTWIICTSTHGAGDLPDNIQAFAKQLESAQLSNLKAYVIGLGDSSYDTFCFGAAAIEKRLKEAECSLAAPLHTIDVLQHPIPEDNAVEWIAHYF